MISKGDADKLKDAIDSHNQHIPMFVYGEINAMVEPEPGPKLFKPGEIDPNTKCHRCGDMGWIDEVSGIPRPCPDCKPDKPEPVTCPRCNGSHKITGADGMSTFPCPDCNGTGELPEPEQLTGCNVEEE